MRTLLAAVAVLVTLAACAPPPPPPPADPLAGIAQALVAAGYTQQPDGTWAPPPPDPLEGIARALRDAGYTQNVDGTWSPPAPPPPTTSPPPTTTTRPAPTWRTGDDPNTPAAYKVMRDASPFKLTGVPYYISMANSESLGTVTREGPAAILTVVLYASLFPHGQGQVDYTIAHESGHVIDITQPALSAPVKALIDQEPSHPQVTEAFADCYAQKRTPRLVSGYWNCPAPILAVTP